MLIPDDATQPHPIINFLANTIVLMQEKGVCIRPDLERERTPNRRSVRILQHVRGGSGTKACDQPTKRGLFGLTVPTSPEGGITAAPALMVVWYLSLRWGFCYG